MKYHKKNKKVFILRVSRKHSSGFTMVELLVAMALFIVAVTVASAAFIRTMQSQRAVNRMSSVTSNASLVIERMAREIRQGIDFNFTDNQNNCPPNGWTGLQFIKPSKGITINYRLNDTLNLIERSEASTGVFAPLQPFTSSDVFVERLCFVVNDPQPPILRTSCDDNPWRVTIFLRIHPDYPGLEDEVINMQTTVDARILPGELYDYCSP